VKRAREQNFSSGRSSFFYNNTPSVEKKGEERHMLQEKTWMKNSEYQKIFLELIQQLGLLEEKTIANNLSWRRSDGCG
jgi:hypothetical protein